MVCWSASVGQAVQHACSFPVLKASYDMLHSSACVCWLCLPQGRVDVNQEAGELKLMVKMNTNAQGVDAKKSKAVKDLKQLSGEKAGGG